MTSLEVLKPPWPAVQSADAQRSRDNSNSGMVPFPMLPSCFSRRSIRVSHYPGVVSCSFRPRDVSRAGIFRSSRASPFAGRSLLIQRKYELALDACHKADKLSHHSSAPCYLKIASVERKLGDFSSALEDAKKAVKVAGEDKSVAVRAHLLRASLLSQMAGKPTDKKLKEAEDEIRQALAQVSGNALAHYNLGFVLLRQERDPEGIAELNAFLAIPGADPETVAEARRMVANPLRARAPFAPDFSFTTRVLRLDVCFPDVFPGFSRSWPLVSAAGPEDYGRAFYAFFLLSHGAATVLAVPGDEVARDEVRRNFSAICAIFVRNIEFFRE
jgi:tetratricopeptide (TPR) repeat protein